MLKIIRLHFLLLALFPISSMYGQSNDCSQVLQKAADTYKEGRISEIADMLQPCLESGFTKQEKVEAYRLLTLTYLYFNEREKAENAMINLLKNEPEYKLRQADPAEFVNLYNSFRTSPILLIGAKAGTNGVDVDVKRNFSLDNSGVHRGKYNSNLGIQGGLFLQFPVSKNISVLTEFLYTVKSYTYKDSLFGYANLEFPEKQAYLEVPVLVNYNFMSGKWVPYFNLGGSFAYLLQAKASPVRTDKTSGNNQRELKEGAVSVKDLRNPLNFNLIASAGIKVKDVLGRGYLFVDLRYTRGLNNIANPDHRYSDPKLMYDYLYVDNNININSFQYSLGYSYPLYKPKLKKKKQKEEQK